MAKIVHFEIPIGDGDRAAAFYGSVLGWQVQRFGEEPYWLVAAGAEEEPGANGALTARDDTHPYPILIAGVEDLDDAIRRVRESGGTVVQEKLPIPGVGWSAYIKDTEGNVLGLFEPTPPAAQ